MLTPSKHDKNCKAELKRKKDNPDDFGVTTVRKLPKDYEAGKGLVKASNDTLDDLKEVKEVKEEVALVTKAKK